MGVVVDVVPNHMAVPTPASLNAALWSVLRDGPGLAVRATGSTSTGPRRSGALLMPVLGPADRRVRAPTARSRWTASAEAGEPVLRYFDHVFPVRPGTEDAAARRAAGPAVLPAGALAGRRRGAQLPPVLRHRHAGRRPGRGRRGSSPRRTPCCSPWSREGRIDGLRIDHPDGLADPRGYLRRLHGATGGAWVVVEKILEGDEQLPADWPCAGTTGYDALLRVGGLFVDPAGAAPLDRALHRR